MNIKDIIALIVIAAIASAWWSETSSNDIIIDELEEQIAQHEKNIINLKEELSEHEKVYQGTLDAIKNANTQIDTIIDNAGKNIDESLSSLQRLKEINDAYDTAFTQLRNICRAN